MERKGSGDVLTNYFLGDKKLMWVFFSISIILTCLFIYERGEFSLFGVTVWEREVLLSSDFELGYDSGRASVYMDIYDHPDKLEQAISDGIIDYNDLPNGLKSMFDYHMREKYNGN